MRHIITAILILLCVNTAYAYSEHLDFDKVEKFFLEGRYEKTARSADKLIGSNAGHKDELYYIKALSELKLGKFAEARQDFGYMISHYGASVRIFDAYVGIGDSYFLEGKITEARDSYKEALDKFSDNKNIAVLRTRIEDCDAKLRSHAASLPVPGEQPNAQKIISVQAGCFKSKGNAERFSQKLHGLGYDSYVEIPVLPTDKLYRVKIGRFTSKEEAQALKARLEKSGYRTKLCTNGTCR